MNPSLKVLVKREFWEHKALWIVPSSAAAFMVVAALVGVIVSPGNVRVGGMPPPSAMPQLADKFMLMATLGMASVIVLAAAITAAVYLLDCLYAERKDRSILFWKSLPVSDRETVLVKFGVATLVVPLGVFVLQMITNLLLTGIITAAARDPIWVSQWNLGDWLLAQAQFAGFFVTALLWYAPVAAWLMLSSVATTRAPLMFAVLPWVILSVAERIVMGSAHVWNFLANRMTPVQAPLDRLASPDLWLGLAAAAGMLYIVIRLRRYRDDT